MTWEAVTALSTAFTGLVILLTVIFAARQVRALNEQSKAMTAQIDHLRRSTQLSGTLAVFDEMFSPELRGSYRFILYEFEERMKDETFHAEALQRAPDPQIHMEVYTLRHLERIGTLIKNGLLDSDAILDFACAWLSECWDRLGSLVREQRSLHNNPFLWENFEYLATAAQRYMADQHVGPSASASE